MKVHRKILDIPVAYQDQEIIVVNKPPKYSVQGGAGIKHPLDKELSLRFQEKLYPVHRLDRFTSGLLIFARSAEAAAKWSALIASKQVVREYEALVATDAPIENTHGLLSGVIMQKGIPHEATTRYVVLESMPYTQELIFNRLKLILGTGRTHQIRIHLAEAGMPILADDVHGNFELNKFLKKHYDIRMLQLVARQLLIPLAEGPKTLTVPLPPHMEEAYIQLFSRPDTDSET